MAIHSKPDSTDRSGGPVWYAGMAPHYIDDGRAIINQRDKIQLNGIPWELDDQTAEKVVVLLQRVLEYRKQKRSGGE